MPNLRIHFANDEFDAVQALAQKEFRGFEEQLRYLLRQELQRLGFLTPAEESSQVFLLREQDRLQELPGVIARDNQLGLDHLFKIACFPFVVSCTRPFNQIGVHVIQRKETDSYGFPIGSFRTLLRNLARVINRILIPAFSRKAQEINQPIS